MWRQGIFFVFQNSDFKNCFHLGWNWLKSFVAACFQTRRDWEVVLSFVFVVSLFNFRRMRHPLELWKHNIFISTANQHLEEWLWQKLWNCCFVRCVSRICERKLAVCEPVTRFNLLGGFEHSQLFSLWENWTLRFAICSCDGTRETAAWSGRGLMWALSNEKYPWRLFLFRRIKTELKKKKTQQYDYLMKVACVCPNVCYCESRAATKSSVVLYFVVSECCAFYVDLTWM